MAKRSYLLLFVPMEEGKKRLRVRWGSWAFVLFVGTVLTVVAMIDRGGLRVGSDSAAGCRLTVVEGVNVRSAPSADADLIETLPAGAEVEGTVVVTDGFRELAGNRWAADQFLTPLAGSTCA